MTTDCGDPKALLGLVGKNMLRLRYNMARLNVVVPKKRSIANLEDVGYFDDVEILLCLY